MKLATLCSRFIALPVVMSVLLSGAQAQSLPDGLVIWREVSGIENIAASAWNPQFKRPHVPSFRTTSDGRIAVNVKGVPYITLLKPEKMDPTTVNPSPPPLPHQPAGAYAMS